MWGYWCITCIVTKYTGWTPEYTYRTHIHGQCTQMWAYTYCGMVKYRPIMLGKAWMGWANLGLSGNKPNIMRPLHDIKVWGDRFNEIYENCVQQTHFGHCYECMIIIRRLFHVMQSRKWHTLPPQTIIHLFIFWGQNLGKVHQKERKNEKYFPYLVTTIPWYIPVLVWYHTYDWCSAQINS